MRRRPIALALVVLAASAVAACEPTGDDPPAPALSPTPVASDAVGLAATRVTAGGYHTCALDGDGAATCWGLGDYGQLGSAGTDSATAPVDVAMPDGVAFAELAAGNAHTCALGTDGSVWCWGIDGDGIHDAQANDAHGPRRVRFPEDVVATSLDGAYHDCVVADDGAAWCWGRDTEGQLGDGSTADSVAPVRVRTPDGVAFARVATGAFHTCALATDGSVWCWGQDLHGQLGDGGDAGDRPTPGPIAAPDGATFVAVTAGFNHTCALAGDGAAWCWGEGVSGQLGDGGLVDATAPTPVAMPDGVAFVAIDAGNAHTCALATDGSVWCWGLGVQGGAAATDVAAAPTAIDLGVGTTAVSVSAGGFHTCAITADGAVLCWGENANGQLGDGTTVGPTGPTLVVDGAA